MTNLTRRPVALLAQRLQCTEGQVFTMLIGLGVALMLAVPGIPAVLRDRPVGDRSSAALSPFAGEEATGKSAPGAAPAPSTPPTISGGGRALPSAGPPSSGGSPGAVSPPPSRQPSRGTGPAPAPGTIRTFARVGSPGAPGGLAVAADGTVSVTTDNGGERGGPGPSRVFSYDAGGALTANRAVTGQRQERVGGLTGVAVDPRSGDLAVLDPDGARILRLDMTTGAQSLLAEIPDLATCLASLGAAPCQPGIVDGAPSPVSAVYDEQRNLLFTDPAQDTIWRLRPGETSPEVWYQSVTFATGDGPFGLALRGGSVEFTVGTTNDPAAFGVGALYRLAVEQDGSPGALTLVRAFERGDAPGSLAVAGNGTKYVVMRGSGAIVTVTPDGAEAGRIEPPGAGTVPLDGPSAVALLPGTLLVANGRTSDDPSRWVVLAVAIDEGAAPAVENDGRLRSEQLGKVA